MNFTLRVNEGTNRRSRFEWTTHPCGRLPQTGDERSRALTSKRALPACHPERSDRRERSRRISRRLTNTEAQSAEVSLFAKVSLFAEVSLFDSEHSLYPYSAVLIGRF